jgi:hypothetical protein
MHAARSAVMSSAVPDEVGGRLNPRPDLIRILDARVDVAEQAEIHAVLKTELHVRVVELQTRLLATIERRGSGVALSVETQREVADLLTEGASRRRPVYPVEVVEVPVVRVARARRVFRIVDDVAVRDHLVVSGSHPFSIGL